MTEKNARLRANNAAESFRNWLPPALVFAVVLSVMFWRLGSYPPYFNDMVDQGIHIEANKVFEHADIANKVNWDWKDMHSRISSFGVRCVGEDAGQCLFSKTTFIRVYFAL